MKETQNLTAHAIMETLMSPNVCDTNLEPANVVDVLAAIGRAIDRLGIDDDNRSVIEKHADAIREAGSMIAHAISDLATAVRETQGGPHA